MVAVEAKPIIARLMKLARESFSYRPKKPQPEAEICNRIFQWAVDHYCNGRMQAIFFHVPNEGREGVRLKMFCGMVPGTADFVFSGEHETVFIEVKTETGRQSKDQRFFETWCKRTPGNSYAVVTSVKQVIEILSEKNILLSEF